MQPKLNDTALPIQLRISREAKWWYKSGEELSTKEVTCFTIYVLGHRSCLQWPSGVAAPMADSESRASASSVFIIRALMWESNPTTHCGSSPNLVRAAGPVSQDWDMTDSSMGTWPTAQWEPIRWRVDFFNDTVTTICAYKRSQWVRINGHLTVFSDRGRTRGVLAKIIQTVTRLHFMKSI